MNLKQDAGENVQLQVNLRTLLRSFVTNMEQHLKARPDKLISNMPKRTDSNVPQGLDSTRSVDVGQLSRVPMRIRSPKANVPPSR